jgi:DNA invertase Pin-like site-specific DNA recombinase
MIWVKLISLKKLLQGVSLGESVILQTSLEQLQAGDVMIVAELSRLGRSMLECMEILALATQKHIRVYSVKGIGN